MEVCARRGVTLNHEQTSLAHIPPIKPISLGAQGSIQITAHEQRKKHYKPVYESNEHHDERTRNYTDSTY